MRVRVGGGGGGEVGGEQGGRGQGRGLFSTHSVGNARPPWARMLPLGGARAPLPHPMG